MSEPKLTISVAASAEVTKQKTRVRAGEYTHSGDYSVHVDAARGELVVQCLMSDDRWKVARVRLDSLADDVVRAMRDVAAEVPL